MHRNTFIVVVDVVVDIVLTITHRQQLVHGHKARHALSYRRVVLCGPNQSSANATNRSAMKITKPRNVYLRSTTKIVIQSARLHDTTDISTIVRSRTCCSRATQNVNATAAATAAAAAAHRSRQFRLPPLCYTTVSALPTPRDPFPSIIVPGKPGSMPSTRDDGLCHVSPPPPPLVSPRDWRTACDLLSGR